MEYADGSNCPALIPAAGLTVVACSSQPCLDVIFVHGFTGHPERTWTHSKAGGLTHIGSHGDVNEPPQKARKLNMFSSTHSERTRTTVYWPRDLVPDTLPNARVLTYGYDTHIRHKLGSPGSLSTVYDIAWDFLVALESRRREEPTRPALFVVHSLGGIVVKEMLRRSSGCRHGQAHLRSVFESTIGILFFGTPHGGADPRGIFQRIAEKAIRAAGFSVNEHIVNTLLPSSERLRELRDEFGPMALDQKWMIHSFQEQVGVTALGGHKVVEDTSSCLHLPALEVCEHIGHNHMDMCRFKGLDDPEYSKVASALRRMARAIVHKISQGRSPLGPVLNLEQRKMLLESLTFDQIDARQMSVKNAHAKTCKWLLSKQEYINWLDTAKVDEHHGFLWIKGKPGSGKSTLIKFALVNARKTMKDSTIISFFFNARGDALEKSTIGTYRSLLLQLLNRLPNLEHILDSLAPSPSTISENYQWSIQTLKELLQQAIEGLGSSSVVCFIDALDECEEDQIRDMMSFFEDVGDIAVSTGVSFHVCLSSRHYPHISIRKGLSLILEGQEGHDQDITNYLNSELKIGHSKLAEQIRAELQEKASGVFMWVVLVVGILNKEHDRGRIYGLRRKLNDIPGDLHELFRDILTRDSQNQEELVLCIRWLLFSKLPLRPEQLYFAILSGVDPTSLSSWDSEDITPDIIKRFILDSSKGLAEVTIRKPRVQFIHESVRDFLLKENGLASVWPEVERKFAAQSHDVLKFCCLSYMDKVGLEIEKETRAGRLSGNYSGPDRDYCILKFPLLDYAVRNVFYHADFAQGNGIDQADFVHDFSQARWIELDNVLQQHAVRRHTHWASLLYLLAENNASNLIKHHSTIEASLAVEDQRYGLPLFAALATGSKNAVQAMAEAYASHVVSHSTFYKANPSALQFIADIANGKLQPEWRGFSRSLKVSHSVHPLSYLVGLGDLNLLSLVLYTGLFQPASDEVTKIFLEAIHKDDPDIVKLLLSTLDVDVNANDDDGWPPLWHAVSQGNRAVVKLLMDTGLIDVNQHTKAGWKMLPFAIVTGNVTAVKLLLEITDIDVNRSSSISPQSPLMIAADFGREDVIQLLLSLKGADLTLRDEKGSTAEDIARSCGHWDIVNLLVQSSKEAAARETSEPSETL